MYENKKLPNRKSNWLRYNLRSFLFGVTILGTCIGWLVYRAERQREAVKWVVEQTDGFGSAYYGFELDSDWNLLHPYKNRGLPSGPTWLIEILGADYFATVIRVDVGGAERVADLKSLSLLPSIEMLDLYNTQISDLKPITGLKRLEWLRLDASPVSDLAPLGNMTDLKSLYLSETHVEDLTPLAGLVKLEFLELENTATRDLSSLVGMTSLKELCLNQTQVDDLTPLEGLTNLELLHLENTNVMDLAPLYGLTRLKELYIRDTRVGATEIRKLELALPNCRITAGRKWRD